MNLRLSLIYILIAIITTEPDTINLVADVPTTSTENQHNNEEQQNIINSEKNQQDPLLRQKFQEQLCEKLTIKDKDGNVTKKVSFEMDENDGIEKRAINRKQVNFLIEVLYNKKNKTKNYHNYNNAYEVRKVGDTLELFGKNKKMSENGGKIIALEDMWDRCWEIHRNVGF